jgi:trehalose synthase
MQDTEFLRLTLNASLEYGVSPTSLVHAMQNHDELTYELVHFATRHKDDLFDYHGEQVPGGVLAERIRADLTDKLTGPAAPYNAVFTTNGIASTTASVISATLGVSDFADLDEQTIATVKKAHLLLAMFNALQPGVFALSGWDLCGMLTLDRDQVSHLIAEGDTRWIHRAAYDLMGYQSNTTFAGMPAGKSLYGSLPDQLSDPDSFVSRLRKVLQVRDACHLATAEQVDVPLVSQRAMLVMVHRLEDQVRTQVTVLNFGQEPVTGTVRSEHLPPGATVTDMFTDWPLGEVDDLNSFTVSLDALEGLSLLVEAAPDTLTP